MAASAISVGIVAVQLTCMIEKFSIFGNLLKNTPEEVFVIRKDLELLTATIQCVNQLQKLRASLVIVNALQQCQPRIERLLAVVQRFESGLAADNKRKRRWSVFKTSFKVNDITKIHVLFEGSRNNLFLALHISSMLEMEDIPTHTRRIPSILQNLPWPVLRELDYQLPVRSDIVKISYSAQRSPATIFIKA